VLHLVMIFDAHAERVDEDGEKNSALKVFAVDKLLHFRSQSAHIAYNHAISRTSARSASERYEIASIKLRITAVMVSSNGR